MAAIKNTEWILETSGGVESFTVKMQELFHHCILHEELIIISLIGI